MVEHGHVRAGALVAYNLKRSRTVAIRFRLRIMPRKDAAHNIDGLYWFPNRAPRLRGLAKTLSNNGADRAEVGAYEAKTKLPELLRKVQQGQRFTITNRGQPVAELIPFQADHAASAMAAAQKMIRLMKSRQGRSALSPTSEQINEWREEGRK